MKQNEKGKISISIKGKLLIGFAVPLICSIIVGMVAYSLAASGMSKNYEDSMSKAMTMAMEYLDFGFESAVSQSEQLYYNTDLMKLATGAIYNDWTRKEIADDTRLDLSIKKRGNEFVDNMYIIPGKNLSVISAYEENVVVPGFYEELEKSKEASCLESLSGNWIGSHEYIDSVLKEFYTGYSQNNYACSYIRPMTTKRACIVVDYSSDAIARVLQNLNLGDKSLSAFITADGRELLLNGDKVATEGDFSFVNQTYFKDAMSENAAMVIDYVKHENEDWLFMVSRSNKNGSAICAMIPVSKVNTGANAIRQVTLVTVIVSCIIAVVVSIFIIAGITYTINQIGKKLKVVSGGDLTVTIDENRGDEFSVLVKNIADMVKNSRNLIVQVLKTTENVSASTNSLADASESFAESNEQIAAAVDEMDTGINQQAHDSQNCLALMDELSSKITLAVDTVRNMNVITNDTKDIISEGMTTMDELSVKSSDTTNITRNVMVNIKNLEQSLEEVEKFVATINNIAEETSLLALNASIEAARAGEAGRGFAVVAQSVSNLSYGTIEASRHIQNVMQQIKEFANETVSVAAQAEEIVSRQAETVNNTIDVFGNMNNYLEGLIREIDSLEKNIESMEKHRNDTLTAVESISTVSQETAASVSVVNDSLKKQREMAGNLHKSTVELEERARELTEAVNAFKIE
ncbi:MAG: methyl-accepting chemotaxis protein [Lachnospiraceae bacterium]